MNGTRVPEWRSGPAGPASVPAPPSDVDTATAALVRVVGLLAGEDEVVVGRAVDGGAPELVAGSSVSPVDGQVEVGLAYGAAGPAGWAATEVLLADGTLTVTGDPERFDASFSARVAGYLARALAGAADLLDAGEREHLLHGLGGPRGAVPGRLPQGLVGHAGA